MTTDRFKHAGLAMLVARRFYIDGMDLDDLHQEAIFAMLRAERDYDRLKGAESTFFYRVAWNQLNTIRLRGTRKMRIPEELVGSLDYDLGNGDTLGDFIEAPNADPALIVEQRDELRRLLDEPSLTDGERACVIASAVGANARDVGVSRTVEYHARTKLRAVV